MNVKNLILSMNNITKITNLEKFTNLDMIDLHDNNISGSIDFQTCFGMLKNLKTLNLSNNSIEEVNINWSQLDLQHCCLIYINIIG